jgi:hypothetical protein
MTHLYGSWRKARIGTLLCTARLPYSRTQNDSQLVNDVLEERTRACGKTSGIGIVELWANARATFG